MGEPETPRVKGLAWKCAQHIRELRVRNSRPEGFAVHRVADNRPSTRGKMRADLMRAAGHQPASQQRQPDTRRPHAAEANEPGETFRSGVFRCGDLASIDAVAAETQRNPARGDVDTTIHNRKVFLLAADPASVRCRWACIAGVFATRTIPEVSLSSRPTIEGR